MRFEANQSMRLGQQMKLAPRMIQSMEILQLPTMALQERIDQELEANVALEAVEPGLELEGLDGAADPEGREAGEAAENREAAREEEGPDRELEVGDDGRDFERADELTRSYGELYDDDYASAMRNANRQSGDRDRKMDAMANTPSRGESLVEQLLHQWSFAEVDPEIAAAGRRIIEYVNADGLLGADLETILEQSRGDRSPASDGAEWSEALFERALAQVQQQLEPPGVAARDVRESLVLQLSALEIDEDDADDLQVLDDAGALVQHHFEDLLENRLPKIEKQGGIPIERIERAKLLLRRLKLSPGRDLVDDDVAPIVPDVLVEYEPQTDSYVAALTDGVLPTLRIAPSYATMARDKTVDGETREFVQRSVRDAGWLIDSINQRKNTLLRVVNVVLTRQREFFDHGPRFLKPLPMVDVADQLGVHVGTVSRAVADKWLQTPRGLVPLRRFFSGGLEIDGGADMSWEAVKELVREVVDGEDKLRPYSDQAIADQLAERGVKIARRTVVKYREQLDIPPARRRKRHVS